MRILIDADGCPVVRIAAETARQYGIECIILCDTSHCFNIEGTVTLTVSKGADSVDFALVNLMRAGDVAITQDYGLAAMCLAKNGTVISQDGMIYDDSNINSLLEARHFAKKIRNSGGRLKGASKRTAAQDEKFKLELTRILSESAGRE